MSGACTVTPGTTITGTAPVDAAALNLLGRPVVQVDERSIGARELIPDEVAAVLGTGASGYNYLDNGNFAENRWTRGSTPTSCPVGTKTFRADQWWCTPSGAVVTYEQALSGPNYLSLMSAKLTGATGVTSVDFGQDIPRRLASALAAPLLCSFWLQNNTGAGLTPTVLVNTANSADNFAATTNALTIAATTAAGNGTWQKYEIALDLSAVATSRGVQIVIRLPSGALSSGSKTVQIAQCKLEATSNTTASPFVPQREAPDSSSAAGAAPYNLLVNGQFDRWISPAATPTCSAGVDTWNAEGWWVNAAGAATATYTRSTATPANSLSLWSARVTGGTGVNVVQFGANLDPATAAKLRRNVILTLWVKYHDGATSVTPTLKLATPATAGAWSAASVQVTATMDPCANDTWTKLTYQFDGAPISNLANGLRLWLEFPSGSLDASSKYVEIAQALLEEGTAASPFKPYLETAQAGLTGAALNLVVQTTSVSQLTIAADEIVLRNPDGRALTVYVPTVTVDIAVSGAGGLDTGAEANAWYYVWVIHNGTSAAGLLSTSAVSPTLPAGYNWRALAGAVYNSSALDFVSFYQAGRKVICAKASTPALNATITTSLASVSLANYVPPTAKTVTGVAGVSSNNGCALSLAADSAGTGQVDLLLSNVSSYSGFFAAAPFEMVMKTAQTIYAKANSATPTHRIDVTGWTY